MKIIIFVAPPAAGKGTQSQMISKKYNLPHISIGAILRNEVEKGTKIGNQIKEELEKGHLIDDNITLKVIKERLKEKDCLKGYILDGFPRTLYQVRLYEKFLEKEDQKIDYVFFLNVDKETAYKRTMGRLICNDCQIIYNNNNEKMKPMIENKCDKCGGILSKRNDDSFKTFETRFQHYLTLTEPLLNYYQQKKVLYEIDSKVNKEIVFKKIVDVIENSPSLCKETKGYSR